MKLAEALQKKLDKALDDIEKQFSKSRIRSPEVKKRIEKIRKEGAEANAKRQAEIIKRMEQMRKDEKPVPKETNPAKILANASIGRTENFKEVRPGVFYYEKNYSGGKGSIKATVDTNKKTIDFKGPPDEGLFTKKQAASMDYKFIWKN